MPIRNQPTEQIERRFFEMRLDAMSEDGDGGGTGTACVMGTLDAYRSVWSPRAFGKPVLAQFVQSGFISDCHDWHADLATIDVARVNGRELNIGWTWYPTEDAQEMRTKCKTRMERKKSVGLSIGASIAWGKVAEFDSGEKLLTYAKGLGEDMSLYDEQGLAKHKGYCWFIAEVTRLYETAITLAPAVPGSQVNEARSIDLLRDGDHGALSFGEALDMVLGAVQGIEGRALDIEELRSENGGRIGRDNLRRIEALRDSLSSLIGRSSTPADDLALRALALRARQLRG